MIDMLTAKDMQTLLQVDRSTIYRMAEAGRLPAIKVGKQWRFPGDLVDNWLNTRTVQNKEPELVPAPVTSTQTALSDLLPLSCVQLLQDTFADSLGVMLVITDMEGEPITQVGHPCGLFTAISRVPDALQKCIVSWHSLAAELDLEPKLVPGHLGLLCARGLIRVGTELKGMVFMGGIAPKTWPPSAEQVKVMAAEFGVTPALLQDNLNDVFYLDADEQAKVLSFVQRIANIIAHIVNERTEYTGKLAAITQLAHEGA